MRFAAVIFDMDGTLIDSERIILDAGLAALLRLGLPPRRDLLLPMVGVADGSGYAGLHAAFGRRFDRAEFDRTWAAVMEERAAEALPLRPGAAELLADLHRRAVPRAVATNSRTLWARDSLERAGIARFFDPAHVHGRDRVARPKPAPDLFLHAAATLGADPAACLVFEDSDPGAEAAIEAGMTVIQIPDQRPPARTEGRLIAASLLDGARAVGLI